MTVWDYRLKEIREALDRFEQHKRLGNEKRADDELEYISRHLYTLREKA